MEQNPAVNKVTGYRKLSNAELQTVNDIKAVGNDIIAPLLKFLDGPVANDTNERFIPNPRHLAIARTQFEIAFAMLIKSVTQPDTMF